MLESILSLCWVITSNMNQSIIHSSAHSSSAAALAMWRLSSVACLKLKLHSVFLEAQWCCCICIANKNFQQVAHSLCIIEKKKSLKPIQALSKNLSHHDSLFLNVLSSVRYLHTAFSVSVYFPQAPRPGGHRPLSLICLVEGNWRKSLQCMLYFCVARKRI